MTNKEKVDTGRLNTIIGGGSIFEGTVEIESSIRIDGTLKGKLVSSDTLIVGPTGVVEADIQVKKATVGGRILGCLVASDQTVLESKAVLLGDLKTSSLVVHEGAVFNGNCSMGEEKSLLEKRESLFPKKSKELEEEKSTQSTISL
ncbi:MAG: polymer-forming cytoskeletal protein [Gemmatimonadota bacterium]|nr:MAG: polymer-forming cytoskeletal protein [Gemmatimonadota bacterium]